MENVIGKVKFLDVGHGDSSIIYINDEQSNVERVIIIDVVNADRLIGDLQENKIKVVDLMIISHFDMDHCRGINDFLAKFMAIGSVKKICFDIDRKNPAKTMSSFLKLFLELRAKYDIEFLTGKNDTSVPKRELLSNIHSKLFLIYPNQAEAIEAYCAGNPNNASIVCLLENGVCNILFTGDLEERGWENLLKRIPDLTCDVLKMPHHGAYYDGHAGIGLREIVDTLHPHMAIISSGNNERYHHPSRQTIELLNEKKIKVYCTEFTRQCHSDISKFEKKCYGDIEVEIVESAYRVNTEVKNKDMLGCALCNL